MTFLWRKETLQETKKDEAKLYYSDHLYEPKIYFWYQTWNFFIIDANSHDIERGYHRMFGGMVKIPKTYILRILILFLSRQGFFGPKLER